MYGAVRNHHHYAAIGFLDRERFDGRSIGRVQVENVLAGRRGEITRQPVIHPIAQVGGGRIVIHLAVLLVRVVIPMVKRLIPGLAKLGKNVGPPAGEKGAGAALVGDEFLPGIADAVPVGVREVGVDVVLRHPHGHACEVRPVLKLRVEILDVVHKSRHRAH